MSTVLSPDSACSAQEAGLRYVDTSQPGFTRHRAGTGFFYRDTNGNRITSKRDLERIRRIVIPPAWNEVWICPFANGHVQATGRDERGRKQYRYHEDWRNHRETTKFERLAEFASALPLIRTAVDKQLRRPGLPREKAIATVVNLLEKTLIRIGNEHYARENRSFGLTTLRNRHVDVNGSTIAFAFRGKSGVLHAVDIADRRLARIIRQMQELPGQLLVQYVDEDGQHQPVTSDDVNQFLEDITGKHFTAKDFRTWAGTVLAASELAGLPPTDSPTGRERQIVTVIDTVAQQLGNTRAVCRACYVHPDVLEAHLQGEIIATGHACSGPSQTSPIGERDLSETEQAVLAMLQQPRQQ